MLAGRTGAMDAVLTAPVSATDVVVVSMAPPDCPDAWTTPVVKTEMRERDTRKRLMFSNFMSLLGGYGPSSAR